MMMIHRALLAHRAENEGAIDSMSTEVWCFTGLLWYRPGLCQCRFGKAI
jgi:hypothetical protein